MAFKQSVVEAAWRMAEGKCECRRKSHQHPSTRCNKELVWENRGREGRGKWEAHLIDSNGPYTLLNCVIMCWDCHKKTL